jgi:hypothetical protein
MTQDPITGEAPEHGAENERGAPVRIWTPIDRPLLTALGLGVLITIVSLAFDFSLILLHWAGPYHTAIISDTALGVVAFVLLYRIFNLGQQRRRQVLTRLASIDEMNHHVRNALQVISFNARVSSDESQLTEIREAVQRINWTLRVVLPKLEPEFEPLEGSAREYIAPEDYGDTRPPQPSA